MITISTLLKKSLYLQLIVAFCLFINVLGAQVMRHVTHTSGTVNYGNTAVTVVGGNNLGMTCYAGLPGGYRTHYSTVSFSLNKPTNHIRIANTVFDYTDTIYFNINGQRYKFNNNELSGSANFATCVCSSSGFIITSDGNIVNTLTTQSGCILIDIKRPNIQSFSIEHGNTVGGASFVSHDVYFFEDTTSFITQPFIDTLFCPGDSLYLPYTTSFDFRTGNSFTAQLSNSSGSFASPVDIGKVADINNGTVPCRIPDNTAAGSGYRIRLVSSNPKDTSLDNQVNIRVKAGPVAFSNTTTTTACTGDTLHLTGSSSTSGLTWGWTGPGGFTASKEDTFIANTTGSHAGSYVLTAALGSTGCSLKDTVTVAVNQSPNKPTASSNNPVCETKTLQLTSAGATGTYTWTGPGSYSSSTQNPMVSSNATLAMSGDYINTVTLNGCTRKDTVTVNVIAKPAKPTVAAPNSPLCASQDLQLTANSSTGGVNYFWYGPAAYNANAQNPVRANAQLNHAGKYYAFVTSSGCASDTDSVTVVVNTDPVVNIFPTPGATICQGSGAIFTAVPTNGGTSAYKWYINNSNTGATAVSYNSPALNNGDKVYCLMTSTGTCATPFTDTSNVITMNVLPPKAPTVSIVADINPPWNDNTIVTFTATVTNASSVAGLPPGYQWKKNGVNIGGAIGNYWAANTNSLSANDKVCVRVKSAYECPVPDTVLSNCINSEFTGVNDVAISSIIVYPNPVTQVLHIDGLATGQSVALYDVVGRKCNIVYQDGSIDMSALPAGNYVLQVTDANGGRAYFKVAKE